MKQGSAIAEQIKQDNDFQNRLQLANAIKHNKRIIHPESYFRSIVGYLPEEVPTCPTVAW